MNAVYSTLRNLREIPEERDAAFFHSSSADQFFHTYADRLRDAKETYMRKLRDNLQEVKDDVRAAKEDGEDFTFDDEQGNVLTGLAAARAARQLLDQLALETYERRLVAAESYRNDLFNYAHALVQNFAKYGDNWWIE